MKKSFKEGKMQMDKINEQEKTLLTAYGGQRLEVIASFEADIEAVGLEKPTVSSKIFIIKGANKALLGRATAERMKLLKIGPSVNTVTHKTGAIQPEVKKSNSTFPMVPNYLVHFQVDASVKPVAQPRVKIPVPLLTRVQERLDEMEAKGIIMKPDRPSDWYSPMEVVHKGPNDFRIVIDMREPNKAITRARYPLPDVRSITFKLAGSAFFTKLDLSHAFHHIPIDEESHRMTTFMTPRGPRHEVFHEGPRD